VLLKHGRADDILKVVVPDMKACEHVVHTQILAISGVANVRTAVVLREVRYDTVRPIDIDSP